MGSRKKIPALLPAVGEPLEAVCGFPRNLLRRRPHSVLVISLQNFFLNQSHYFRDKPRKADTDERVLTLLTKVSELEAQVAKCKEIETEHQQVRHKLKAKHSKLLAEYKHMKECAALFQSTQENLENEKAIRNYLDDNAIAMEKDLLNEAQAGKNVLKRMTKASVL
jgi:hypothetical protein